MSRKAVNVQAPENTGLPAAMCVWLASSEADFFKGRSLWANCDVDEMQKRKNEIMEQTLLSLAFHGLPVGTLCGLKED